MDPSHLAIVPRPLSDPPEALARQLDQAVALVKRYQRFLVAAHFSPDGDAIGSTMALTHMLRELGKTAVPFNRDPVPYTFRFLPGIDEIIHDVAAIDPDVEVVFVLDCSCLERVHPDLRLDRARTRVVCMDHHETVDDDCADVFVHDTGASSIGELLYRLLVSLEHRLTTTVATCLFTSIQTDTGSFRYSNTSPEALMAAAETVRAGADVWAISSAVYENHPEGRVRLLGQVLQTLELAHHGRVAFLTVTQQMYDRTRTGPEMLDGFINHARSITGVEAAVQLREVGDGEYRVSFRSRGLVNVAKVAQEFGGGGHRNAAGCTVKGSAREVIDRVGAELGRVLGS